MNREFYEDLLVKRDRELKEAQQRLTIAQHTVTLLMKAYDALLFHGINYRKLRTYELWERFLAFGEKVPEGHKTRTLSDWAVKIGNDIDAAVRRKNIKEV